MVCGVAAHSLPGRVADIAVAGSPGMRVAKASHLHTSAQVWAMRDTDDWIQDVPYLEVGGLGHGADPVSAAFGARVLSARGADGHSRLLRAGHGEPAQLRRDRRWRIPLGARARTRTRPAATGLSGTAAAGRA